MKTTQPLLRRPRFWLIVITLIGGLLRFTYLLQIEHNTDRAYPIWQALMTLEHGTLPLIGQGTSVLFANPPGMGYLLLPVMALTHSALGAYLLVIALNTLGIWFTYKAVRLIASPRAALIAAFLMAVNPWMIEYSRLTWVQGLLPFLVPALAWALWSALLGVAKHPTRRLILALILLTIAAQTYLLAFMLVAPVGLTILMFLVKPQTSASAEWRRGMLRGLIIGGLIFAAFGALYTAGLAAERDTVGSQIANFGQNPSHLSSEALSHAIRLVTGQDYAVARGVDAPASDSTLRESLSQVAHYVLLAGMILGVALSIWQVVRGDRRGLLLLIWYGIPILLMSYVGQPVHPFYQLLGIPAGFALAGIGIDRALRFLMDDPEGKKGRQEWRPYGAALLILLAIPFGILMAINSIRYAQETQRYPGAHGLTALSLEYGLPLGSKIREVLPSGGTVFSDVEGWILSSFAGTTFDTMQEARAPQVMIVPHNGGVYVAASTNVEEIASNFAPDQRVSTLTLPDETALFVGLFPQGMADFLAHNIEIVRNSAGMSASLNSLNDADGGNGIRPVTYRLNFASGTWTLSTLWVLSDTLPENTDQTLFAPFAHIFDADGNRVLIADGQVLPGYEWRVGDVHLHQMTFTLPQDGHAPYTIAIGQYDSTHDQNAIFITADGEYTPLVNLPDKITPDGATSR